jgi:hypothetical protein
MRFGLASYSPTFSTYAIFQNVVNYQRPAA